MQEEPRVLGKTMGAAELKATCLASADGQRRRIRDHHEPRGPMAVLAPPPREPCGVADCRRDARHGAEVRGSVPPRGPPLDRSTVIVLATHVLICAMEAHVRLRRAAHSAIAEAAPERRVGVSAITPWPTALLSERPPSPEPARHHLNRRAAPSAASTSPSRSTACAFPARAPPTRRTA